ncbi:MAG: ATP-binding protein [Planctomycetota bacterium]
MEIHVLNGALEGLCFPLSAHAISIGRHEEQTLCLDDKSVALHHVVLEPPIAATTGRWRLRVVDPAGVCAVNDATTRDTELKPGDVFAVGATRFALRKSTVIAAGAPAPVAPKFAAALLELLQCARLETSSGAYLDAAEPIVRRALAASCCALVDWPDGLAAAPRVFGASAANVDARERVERSAAFLQHAVRHRSGYVASGAGEASRLVAPGLPGRDFVLFVERHGTPALGPRELAHAEVLVQQLSAAVVCIERLEQLGAENRALAQDAHRLRRLEKLAAIGPALAELAHEITNPLSSVVCFAELAERLVLTMPQSDGASGKLHSYIKKTHDAALLCQALTSKALASARQLPSAEPADSVYDARMAIQGALDNCHARLQTSGVQVELRMPAHLWLNGDPQLLQQVVMNLVSNASDAIQEQSAASGRIVIHVEGTASHLELRVTDNGPGIPESLRQRIFEPHFTTKCVGKGTGLGLHIVKSLLQQLDGSIELAPTNGCAGATFIVRLPAGCIVSRESPSPSMVGVRA